MIAIAVIETLLYYIVPYGGFLALRVPFRSAMAASSWRTFAKVLHALVIWDTVGISRYISSGLEGAKELWVAIFPSSMEREGGGATYQSFPSDRY